MKNLENTLTICLILSFFFSGLYLFVRGVINTLAKLKNKPEPVQTIIKEVPQIIYKQDDTQTAKILKELQALKEELAKKAPLEGLESKNEQTPLEDSIEALEVTIEETEPTLEVKTAIECPKEPENIDFFPIYETLKNQTHLLVAGATGSGKSVVANGIIHQILQDPELPYMLLIDPKRVELSAYKDLPQVLGRATEPSEILQLLEYAVEVMEDRFEEMEREQIKKSKREHMFVILDELADIMTQIKKEATPLLARLAQLGRAANIHLLLCTQRPTQDIIDGRIMCNIDSRLALHTRNAQDSRNILGVAGAEKLPKYGKGILISSETDGKMVDLPKVDESQTMALVQYHLDYQAYNEQR